jgi:hypothetical protein
MSDLGSLAAIAAAAIGSLAQAKVLYEASATNFTDWGARSRLNSAQAARDAAIASVQGATPANSEVFTNQDGLVCISWTVGNGPICGWQDPTGRQYPNAGENLANYLTLYPNAVS